MDEVFRKLQYKDQERIYVAGAPPEFKQHLQAMKSTTKVVTSPSTRSKQPFALFFAKRCADIAKLAPKAGSMIEDDGLLWFAYPKKSSKRYESDIGRDDSWQPLGDQGFEAVRMIAIDEDWSAVRFRRAEHIKSMKRDPKRAMTTKGKQRARAKR